jgi:YHS domain-containing protein
MKYLSAFLGITLLGFLGVLAFSEKPPHAPTSPPALQAEHQATAAGDACCPHETSTATKSAAGTAKTTPAAPAVAKSAAATCPVEHASAGEKSAETACPVKHAPIASTKPATAQADDGCCPHDTPAKGTSAKATGVCPVTGATATKTTGKAAPQTAASSPSKAGVAAAPKTSGVMLAADEAACPVMGGVMKKADMIPVEYKGVTYYMCCAGCPETFLANPAKYIKQPAPPRKG